MLCVQYWFYVRALSASQSNGLRAGAPQSILYYRLLLNMPALCRQGLCSKELKEYLLYSNNGATFNKINA